MPLERVAVIRERVDLVGEGTTRSTRKTTSDRDQHSAHEPRCVEHGIHGPEESGLPHVNVFVVVDETTSTIGEVSGSVSGSGDHRADGECEAAPQHETTSEDEAIAARRELFVEIGIDATESSTQLTRCHRKGSSDRRGESPRVIEDECDNTSLRSEFVHAESTGQPAVASADECTESRRSPHHAGQATEERPGRSCRDRLTIETVGHQRNPLCPSDKTSIVIATATCNATPHHTLRERYASVPITIPPTMDANASTGGLLK